MPTRTRIVTSTCRNKRRPWKTKPDAGDHWPGRRLPEVDSALVQRGVKPRNDNHSADSKSRIVQAKKPKDRRKVWVDVSEETPPEVKAIVARMMPSAWSG